MNRPVPTINNSHHNPDGYTQQSIFKVNIYVIKSYFLSKTKQRNRIYSYDIPEINFIHFNQIMLLGDSGVGKTCLLVRFKDDTFLSGSFIATVGIDFRNKTIVINNRQVKLQIYDTVCIQKKKNQ